MFIMVPYKISRIVMMRIILDSSVPLFFSNKNHFDPGLIFPEKWDKLQN